MPILNPVDPDIPHCSIVWITNSGHKRLTMPLPNRDYLNGHKFEEGLDYGSEEA